MFIEAEEKLSGEMWRGDFPSKYIEEISSKTGHPKKFPHFVKMIIGAFKTLSSDHIYVDLLTYQDLEALKNKRSGSTTTAQPNPANSKKRYVIMTETLAGGDKVHYPLPLTYIEEPEPDALRRTIERMRSQILMQKSNAFSVKSEPARRLDDFASIETENDMLRKQIAEVERNFSLTNQDFFAVSQQKFFTESEYDFYKGEA